MSVSRTHIVDKARKPQAWIGEALWHSDFQNPPDWWKR